MTVTPDLLGTLRVGPRSRAEGFALAGQIDPATSYIPDLKRLPDFISRQILRHVDHRKPGLSSGVALEGETRDRRLTITPFPRPGQPATREPCRQRIHTTDAVPSAERHDPAPHPSDPVLVAS